MRIVLCDVCGKKIEGGVIKTHNTTDDFCSRECLARRKEQPVGG